MFLESTHVKFKFLINAPPTKRYKVLKDKTIYVYISKKFLKDDIKPHKQQINEKTKNKPKSHLLPIHDSCGLLLLLVKNDN
jgi:hypothetical protein